MHLKSPVNYEKSSNRKKMKIALGLFSLISAENFKVFGTDSYNENPIFDQKFEALENKQRNGKKFFQAVTSKQFDR